MIGDIIRIKDHHIPPAREIVEYIKPQLSRSDSVFTVTIGGESGSGKSTLGLAIKKVLEEESYRSFIFHMDDYFVLPPRDNHDRRLNDIKHVGPEEVKLNMLQQNLDEAKRGKKKIKKPLMHYRENRMREIIVEMDNVQVVIAEGTYVTLLERIDCKIFMQRSYLDTYENRIKRARDPITPFNEEVLEIEHEIIQSHAERADILVDKNYCVKINNHT